MKVVANACRLVVGAVFAFSGLVKGIDPMGSVYKFTEYFHAFGMGWLDFSATFFAFVLPTLEFATGMALVFNARPRLATWAGLLFMAVFTPLTLVLALTDPVSDCGCFGDAVTLTNWQTFWKNLALLACAAFAFLHRRRFVPATPPAAQWTFILLAGAFIVGVAAHGYTRLPLVDFRPYAVGTDIPAAMRIPEGEEPDQYAMTLTYRNKTTGETRKFSEEDYPWQDTLTWEYVSSSERLVKKGYQPPIQDLYIEHPVFGDISTDILESTGYTFLAVARNLDECDTDAQPALNALARWAAANGHSFWGLTSSPRETVARYRDLENTPYDFCAADETQLKTMIRSNPGLILLHGGTIIGKWPGGALPTPERIGATDPAAFCLQEQQHLRREYLVSSFILLFFALYFALPRTRKKR